MTGDQIVFLSLASVLIFSSLNAFSLNQKYGWKSGESFWFWGMGFLAMSCLAFGVSPYFAHKTLPIANLALLGSYFALIFQVRSWQNGKRNVPIYIYLLCIIYVGVFEFLRHNLTYAERAFVVHATLSVTITYLLFKSLQLYRRYKSQQLLLLSITFGIEATCAILRLAIPLFDTPVETTTLYSEGWLMVALRWIWTTTNAISYLTIMTYQIEKITDKNEDLQSLIVEKNQLLHAATMINRTENSGLIAGTVMHELRQPLSSIVLSSSVLHAELSKLNNDSDLVQFAEIIERESKRSTDLINHLESIYRVKADHHQNIQMTDLIENALKILSHRIENNQITVEKFYDANCTVTGDPIQLEAVITNILSNSIRVLSGQDYPRVISIRIAQKGRQVWFEIKDNGPGIDPKILPIIYQPFVSGSTDGIGIGLWLSKIIIEAHKGSISCRNIETGGACFEITLPAATNADTSRS